MRQFVPLFCYTPRHSTFHKNQHQLLLLTRLAISSFTSEDPLLCNQMRWTLFSKTLLILTHARQSVFTIKITVCVVHTHLYTYLVVSRLIEVFSLFAISSFPKNITRSSATLLILFTLPSISLHAFSVYSGVSFSFSQLDYTYAHMHLQTCFAPCHVQTPDMVSQLRVISMLLMSSSGYRPTQRPR